MLKQKENKSKKKFLISDRKGMSITWTQIIYVIIGVVALFIILGFFTPAAGKIKDFFGGQIKAVADDCDKDRINNEFDDCPCLSTIGDGEDKPGFLGCPKGTSYEEQQQDKTTCLSWYAVGGKVTSDCRTIKGQTACPEKDTNQKEFKTRCDAISATSIVISEMAGRGIKGDWDLAITKLDINPPGSNAITSVQDREAQVPIDLERKFDVTVPVDFEIKNLGSQEVIDSFSLTYSICDKTKVTCKEIKNEAVNIPGLKAGISFSQQKYPIKLGLDGDYCDGKEETSCYVKLTADSNNILYEKNRLNNEVWFRVVLRNQGFTQYQFKKYYRIGVNSDHSSDGLITFYQENMESYNTPAPDGGCWIIGTLKKSFLGIGPLKKDGEGSVATRQKQIISYITPTSLSIIHDWPGSDSGALDMLKSGTWKADSRGSLVCKEGYWHLCDVEANNKLLPIGNDKFTCEGQIWK